jgi:hypothetical protein
MCVGKKSPFGHVKHGALHKSLEIPQAQRIPVTLLRKILQTTVGTTIRNPCRSGKQTIRVTGLLKRRVNFALNARAWHHG